MSIFTAKESLEIFEIKSADKQVQEDKNVLTHARQG